MKQRGCFPAWFTQIEGLEPGEVKKSKIARDRAIKEPLITCVVKASESLQQVESFLPLGVLGAWKRKYSQMCSKFGRVICTQGYYHNVAFLALPITLIFSSEHSQEVETIFQTF